MTLTSLMSPFDRSLGGFFYLDHSSKKQEGIIEFTDREATVISGDEIVCSKVPIDLIQGKSDIYLKDGLLFTLNEPISPQLEKTLTRKSGRMLSQLENFSLPKMILLIAILICVIVGIRYALKSSVPVVVSIFPYSMEKEIGANTYEFLSDTYFDNTELPKERIEALRRKVSELASANGFESPEIFFHKSDAIGANALAFPGGPIVITDDLADLLDDDELLLGVIAHELAHYRDRHSLHQLIEFIGISLIVSTLFGADQSWIEETAFLGVGLWQKKISRDFEKEADLKALTYLEKAGLDKSTFFMAIEKLTKHLCPDDSPEELDECLENNDYEWLSTHPSGSERLKYLSSLN